MLTLKSSGGFPKLEKFLNSVKKGDIYSSLSAVGERGVAALRAATPVDTSQASNSWYYQVVKTSDGVSLVFRNNDIAPNGVPVVVLLTYGHGTRGGTYVSGRNFIMPALTPIFDSLAEEVWMAVKKA